jgi:hypothetical protein
VENPQHSTHRNSIQKSVYCWVVVRKFLDGSIWLFRIVISARMGADFPMIPGFAPKVRSEIWRTSQHLVWDLYKTLYRYPGDNISPCLQGPITVWFFKSYLSYILRRPSRVVSGALAHYACCCRLQNWKKNWAPICRFWHTSALEEPPGFWHPMKIALVFSSTQCIFVIKLDIYIR